MKAKKAYHKMTAAELAEATKGLEDGHFEDTRPLSPELQEKWERSRRRGRGRPRIGQGARAVLVTIERG